MKIDTSVTSVAAMSPDAQEGHSYGITDQDSARMRDWGEYVNEPSRPLSYRYINTTATDRRVPAVLLLLLAMFFAVKVLLVFTGLGSLPIIIGSLLEGSVDITAVVTLTLAIIVHVPDIHDIKMLARGMRRVKISEDTMGVRYAIDESYSYDDESVLDARRTLFTALKLFRDYANSGSKSRAEAERAVTEAKQALDAAMDNIDDLSAIDDSMDEINAAVIRATMGWHND